uniref:Uncharacterized protein n=1 Tax=Chromera velia CCMP2878 TaxID=1169474 RepID=A0A0G4GRV3_9ALVE|eukprot:Cvel_23116.t1-p1 / transcript=Cvel_23116.t1 / gene=Cvel_23116 / organism=Chromera_velia_CCMP2878 / gene_product=Sensory rhodopsin-2, putative / transcript_product=Sensory rhodopsin-2, putative / location=Cvel_scaffold2347:24104-27453(+) / protein_length=419 / sequence_SO=supercontig / SO=protein_coding / is_pseudo=false
MFNMRKFRKSKRKSGLGTADEKKHNDFTIASLSRVHTQGLKSRFQFVTSLTCWLFYWTRFPDPHVKDERLAVFSLCTSLNGYIMLFSAFVNLVQLSQADDVVFDNCFVNDIAKYVQFAITCPLLSWQVSLLARSKRQRQVETVLNTFLMLVMGVWTNSTPEFQLRMMGFGLTFFFFILLMINLDWAIRETTDNRESFFKGTSHLRYICLTVGITWVTFPVTWLLGPVGIRAIPAAAETVVITVMDLTSKIAFSAYVYYVRFKWSAALKQEAQEQEEAEKEGKADEFKRHRKRKMSFVTGNQLAEMKQLSNLEEGGGATTRTAVGKSPSRTALSPSMRAAPTYPAQFEQAPNQTSAPPIVIANCFDVNALGQLLQGQTPAVFNGGGAGAGATASPQNLMATVNRDYYPAEVPDEGEAFRP